MTLSKPIKCLNDRDPVVMVDDSFVDIEIAKRFYEYSQLENPFLTLGSGQEFLNYQKAVREGKAPLPAIVLLDVNMPGMNGFDVLEELRSQPEFKDVPLVVMLSNSDNPSDIELSLKLGADDYHTKGFDMEDYVSFFNSLLPE